ncbi:MAG: hypothetical protein JST28_07420 [Acidobacteria bacterium]|nr:hypothetical protein [Acidobacteriota bacterium]
MATSAGSRNVRMVDGRIGVASSQYLMGISMAVQAIGTDEPSASDFGVHAVRVGSASRGVAGDAKDLLRRRLVRETFHIFVAVDAGQLHRAVDGMLKLLAVYEERHLLAVDFLG